MSKPKLRIGMVGYGFMGRTHSNAFREAPKFFDLPHEPELTAICARNKDRAEEFAANWGYGSVETDWRALIERDDIDLIDIAAPVAEDGAEAATEGRLVAGSGSALDAGLQALNSVMIARDDESVAA